MAQIEISKTGTVTSMEGVVVPFSEEMLRGIADRYDPALHEAPFVIGHPAHDAPAYAWAKGLSFADGVLCADAHQIDPEFADLHRKGRFKKVSARFYTPSSPNNPTPGEYYLRDVGFLGGMAPAVKGLRTASFADDSEVVALEVSFGDLPAHTGNLIARMFRGMRDFLISDKGQETADRVLPDWAIESLRESSQRASEAPPGVRSFADVDLVDTSTTNPQEKPSMSKTVEQLQADLEAARAENDRLKAADQARQSAELERANQARHREHASFADSLIAAAKWPAGAKDLLVATLDHIAAPGADNGRISFGDGDQAKPLHVALREQLESMPASVSFAEVAGKSKAKGAGQTVSDRQVADRAAAYQKRLAAKGQSITISQAVDAVNAGTDQE